MLAAIRPENGPRPYEVRFETPPGVQAQVGFARFVVDSSPERRAIVTDALRRVGLPE